MEKSKLNVLFVFSIAKLNGGAAAVWMNLLDGLVPRGINPFVVLPTGGDGTMLAALDKRGIPHEECFFTWWTTEDANPHSLVRKTKRMAAKRLNAAAEARIEKIMQREQIDVLYICDGTITAGLSVAKKAGIPVLWHFHQFINGGKGGISFIDSDKEVDEALGQAACVITVNEALADDLRGRFPSCKRIEPVYNGITPEAMGRTGGILQGDEVVFTLAGRIDGNKRQTDAVTAFMAIADCFPQARLQIVGTGEPETVARLQALVKDMRLDRCISLMGFRDDMPQILSGTDVALNCSLTEGCSMVIAEAMCSGCLALCSDAVGNRDILEAGFAQEEEPFAVGAYGLLYKRRNAAALVQAMTWVLENKKAARDIAAAAQVHALEKFSLDRQIEQVHGIIQELCS